MKKPSNIDKIHTYLGEFTVTDYACYGASELPKGSLDLYYDRCDKKVFVFQDDTVYGSLKLNEMEQKFIFAILSSKMNLLECSRIPSDEKAPLDQKFKVGLWMKRNPLGCIDTEKGITLEAINDAGDKSEISIDISKMTKDGEKIETQNIILDAAKYSVSIKLNNKEIQKTECTQDPALKIQDLVNIFFDCCDSDTGSTK